MSVTKQIERYIMPKTGIKGKRPFHCSDLPVKEAGQISAVRVMVMFPLLKLFETIYHEFSCWGEHHIEGLTIFCCSFCCAVCAHMKSIRCGCFV